MQSRFIPKRAELTGIGFLLILFQMKQHLLNILSAVVLAGGLACAILIYQSAENRAQNAIGYAQGYPVNPQDSKKYLGDLKLYGGKANILMDELRRWLVEVWHGKSLAFIVAFVTLGVSLLLFYSANRGRPR
jgi:hypothetical protein